MARDEEDEITLEGTLGLIKPDSVRNEIHIMERVRDEGFLLVERRKFRFTRDMAEEFYKHLRHKPFFEDLIDYMTSGDTVGLCLARKDGIEHWKRVIGPTSVTEAMRFAPNSLRARFGNPENDLINALHGSDDPESSEREIEIIFPHILQGGEDADGYRKNEDGLSIDETLDKSVDAQPDDNKAYLQRHVCPTLLKGLTEMYETRPRSPISWLADWLVDNNPYH